MRDTVNLGGMFLVGHFSSYCRCVNATRESNGKSKGQGNRKNGNKFLAWAFV